MFICFWKASNILSHTLFLVHTKFLIPPVVYIFFTVKWPIILWYKTGQKFNQKSKRKNWSEASNNVYSSRPRIKMFASLVIRTWSLRAARSFSVKPRTITLIACLLVFFMTPTSSFGSTNVTKTMILILNGIIKNKISMARKPAYWSSKAACDVSIYLKFDVS